MSLFLIAFALALADMLLAGGNHAALAIIPSAAQRRAAANRRPHDAAFQAEMQQAIAQADQAEEPARLREQQAIHAIHQEQVDHMQALHQAEMQALVQEHQAAMRLLVEEHQAPVADLANDELANLNGGAAPPAVLPQPAPLVPEVGNGIVIPPNDVPPAEMNSLWFPIQTFLEHSSSYIFAHPLQTLFVVGAIFGGVVWAKSGTRSETYSPNSLNPLEPSSSSSFSSGAILESGEGVVLHEKGASPAPGENSIEIDIFPVSPDLGLLKLFSLKAPVFLKTIFLYLANQAPFVACSIGAGFALWQCGMLLKRISDQSKIKDD